MINSKHIEHMKRLVLILNEARKRYYVDIDTGPIMSDASYDKLFRELSALEDTVGIRLSDSPTKHDGFNEDGDKIQHPFPILSLKDTKDINDLHQLLKEEKGVLSWKLDGISIVLYYRYGKLQRALSRGDGHRGKDITKNVLLMRDVPTKISDKGETIIRGEGCLPISEFDKLKQTEEGERYSNPRNLAAGLVNAPKTTSPLLGRMIFIAHSAVLLSGDGGSLKTRVEQLSYMKILGFNVVPYSVVNRDSLAREIVFYTDTVKNYDILVDGLVLTLDDILLGCSMGSTARFPKHSLAFKWPDAHKKTRVTGMKWSVSQTGLITPVVIFEPVEIEGTTVRQANLHNLKIFQDFKIGLGDTLQIYKANKIIPAVYENLTRSNTETYPRNCPVCGDATTIEATHNKQGIVLTKKLLCPSCFRLHSVTRNNS